MDDFSKLLEQVHELKKQKRSGFIGFNSDGKPEFAKMEETIGILGGPRSGKGSGLVIPSVAVHPGPAVITSIRNDIRDATRQARQAVADEFGGKVIELDFTDSGIVSNAEVQQWSILDGFSTFEECALLARNFARTALPNPEHDHWRDSAARLISAYAYAARVSDQTFPEMVKTIFRPLPGSKNILFPGDLINGRPGQPTVKTYATLLRKIAEDTIPYYESAGTPLLFQSGVEIAETPWDFMNSVFGIGNTGENERASILNFTYRALEPWLLHKSSSAPKFNMDDFIGSHSTVYINLPEDAADQLSPMVVAFLACLNREWASRYAGTGFSTDRPLLLALDETANVSPIPQLDKLLSTGGGNGIQTITVFQDPEQPLFRWREKAKPIVNMPNHKLLCGGIEDIDYLDKLSRLTGIYFKEGTRVIAAHSKNYTSGVATPSRLVRERILIEIAIADTESETPERDRVHDLMIELLNARYKDNLFVRKQYTEKTGDDHEALLREIFDLTDIDYTRDQRQNIEIDDFDNMPTEHAYRRSRASSGFVEIPPFFKSGIWQEMFGFSNEGIFTGQNTPQSTTKTNPTDRSPLEH